MKIYQPNRKDLLINTDWGIPEDKLSKEDAKNKNLVLFKKRWVTKKEKKILTKQNNTYISIRGMSALLIIGSMIALAFLVTSPESWLPIAIGVVISFITAIGLWHFKGWARWVATVIYLLPITYYIIYVLFISLAPKYISDTYYIFFMIVIVFYYHLHNKIARQIFKSL